MGLKEISLDNRLIEEQTHSFRKPLKRKGVMSNMLRIIVACLMMVPCVLSGQAFGEDKCLEGDCVNGKGIMEKSEGIKYEGDFKDGLPHGSGKFVYPPEKPGQSETYVPRPVGTYEGQVERGLAEGKGTFTFLDGSKYVGDFKNNKMEGKGHMTNANGIIYEGDFAKGRPNGQGTATFPDGRKYVGGVVENHIHGNGVMTYPDGSKYEGGFQMDKKHGKGVMTYPDGKKEEGEFKEDQFVGADSGKQEKKQ